jgi:tetratricopeptide (TPR) repeat protein
MPAGEWYRKALRKFEKEPERYPSYIAWARRYLGDTALRGKDYAAAEASYTALLQVVDATPSDLDRLGSIRALLKRYGGAAEAWREAEKLDPARGDRYRYCWRVARMAESLGSLPETSPSGESFRDLGREALETLMKEQAQVVKDARAELAAAAESKESPPPERLAQLQAAADAARPLFTAAALEYAVRELPIRETAFFGGYAPLIFHQDQWILDPPEQDRPKRAKGKAKGKRKRN